jgi:hypothetical protein
MRQYARSLLMLFMISSQMLSCTGPELQKHLASERDIILYKGGWENNPDIRPYKEIASELGLTTKVVDGDFINRREEFFDTNGQRRFKVLIIPGGEHMYWFEKRPRKVEPPPKGLTPDKINCQGVNNILDFMKSGGSVIAMCHCGTTLFSSRAGWLNPNMEEGRLGMWDKTHPNYQGWFNWMCDSYAFEGIIVGPQETNRPYPKDIFLPLKMNPENEIVREANLPPVIHIIVTGAGSIIPYKNQPLDVVAWFPNGTAAIGVVPYGSGRIILSGPHPNITGQRAEKWREKMMCGDYARWCGLTGEMIRNNRKIIQSNPDPDGPEPDWALAKAMLSYAHKKAAN